MRRLTLRQPWQLELESVEPAELRPGDVRVAVGATGVCASDVHGYTGRSSRRAPGTVMGHEVAGTVVEAGAAVATVGIGDRVSIDPVVWCGTCDLCRAGHTHLCVTRRLYGCTPPLPGGFADEIVVRAENIIRLDPRLSFAVASLIEPLAVGLHAAGRGAPDADERVLVLGAGMIGLATALAASRITSHVVVAEPDEGRRRTAGELDLEACDPAALAERASDLVFECVGGSTMLDAAVRYTRPRGRIVAVGLADEQVPVSMSPLVMEERTIVGSAVYMHEEFIATAAWTAEEHDRLAPLVEELVDLDGLAGAIDDLARGRRRPVRTVLTPA